MTAISPNSVGALDLRDCLGNKKHAMPHLALVDSGKKLEALLVLLTAHHGAFADATLACPPAGFVSPEGLLQVAAASVLATREGGHIIAPANHPISFALGRVLELWKADETVVLTGATAKTKTNGLAADAETFNVWQVRPAGVAYVPPKVPFLRNIPGVDELRVKALKLYRADPESADDKLAEWVNGRGLKLPHKPRVDARGLYYLDGTKGSGLRKGQVYEFVSTTFGQLPMPKPCWNHARKTMEAADRSGNLIKSGKRYAIRTDYPTTQNISNIVKGARNCDAQRIKHVLKDDYKEATSLLGDGRPDNGWRDWHLMRHLLRVESMRRPNEPVTVLDVWGGVGTVLDAALALQEENGHRIYTVSLFSDINHRDIALGRLAPRLDATADAVIPGNYVEVCISKSVAFPVDVIAPRFPDLVRIQHGAYTTLDETPEYAVVTDTRTLFVVWKSPRSNDADIRRKLIDILKRHPMSTRHLIVPEGLVPEMRGWVTSFYPSEYVGKYSDNKAAVVARAEGEK